MQNLWLRRLEMKTYLVQMEKMSKALWLKRPDVWFLMKMKNKWHLLFHHWKRLMMRIQTLLSKMRRRWDLRIMHLRISMVK
jgi:hypothetical protein